MTGTGGAGLPVDGGRRERETCSPEAYKALADRRRERIELDEKARFIHFGEERHTRR